MTRKASTMEPEFFHAILQEAHAAAAKAQVGAIEGKGLDCGFAWVVVDGNSPLARFCRSKNCLAEGKPHGYYGRKNYPKGWSFWKPGDYAGQSIGIHELGANAFRSVLAIYSIRADSCSRFD